MGIKFMNTNKCLPDSSYSYQNDKNNKNDKNDHNDQNKFNVSKNPKINEIFEILEIKNQIVDYLDCFWCEHGQILNHIISCNIYDLNEIETRPNDKLFPIKAEILIAKQQCGCKGTLIVNILNSAKVISVTPIYPIPFRKRDIIEVGVDEVGRGCIFGPVTSGAVIWPPDLDNETTRRLIKDSKELTEPQREEAYAYILENAVSWGIASLDNHEIDNTNISRAAIKTMHMAIDQTFINPQHIIADGNNFYIYTDQKGEPVNHTTVIKGDNKYYSIAAASIIAKVTRDREMIKLEQDHPELIKYGIASNKGYGAAVHTDAIKKYGLTDWHRRSFGPCKNFN
jgi:ribonuclease HII